MPALSNHDQNNLISESQNNGGSQVEVQSRSSSEFLYHINHPEDVGAVVTSFCKVIQVCLKDILTSKVLYVNILKKVLTKDKKMGWLLAD